MGGSSLRNLDKPIRCTAHRTHLPEQPFVGRNPRQDLREPVGIRPISPKTVAALDLLLAVEVEPIRVALWAERLGKTRAGLVTRPRQDVMVEVVRDRFRVRAGIEQPMEFVGEIPEDLLQFLLDALLLRGRPPLRQHQVARNLRDMAHPNISMAREEPRFMFEDDIPADLAADEPDIVGWLTVEADEVGLRIKELALRFFNEALKHTPDLGREPLAVIPDGL